MKTQREKSQKSPNEEKDLQTNEVSDHDTIVFVTIHPKGLIMQFNVNKLITGQQPRLHHTGDNPARFIWTAKLICAYSVYFWTDFFPPFSFASTALQ